MEAKLKDRLLKLLALTESSNEHEAASAQSRIEKLCAKHGVNINDLLDVTEEVTMHWFRYDNAQSRKVLYNTIWKASNINSFYKNSYKQRQVGVKCTKSQDAEIDLWWSVMRESFNVFLKDIASAFISANNLYGVSEEAETETEVDIDWDEYERVQKLAQGLEPTAVLKRLE